MRSEQTRRLIPPKNHGVIIIWFDESEQDAIGDNPDDFNHTIGEIVISSRAHANVNGVPYASPVNYTHSSDLRAMQQIFRVGRCSVTLSRQRLVRSVQAGRRSKEAVVCTRLG